MVPEVLATELFLSEGRGDVGTCSSLLRPSGGLRPVSEVTTPIDLLPRPPLAPPHLRQPSSSGPEPLAPGPCRAARVSMLPPALCQLAVISPSMARPPVFEETSVLSPKYCQPGRILPQSPKPSGDQATPVPHRLPERPSPLSAPKALWSHEPSKMLPPRKEDRRTAFQLEVVVILWIQIFSHRPKSPITDGEWGGPPFHFWGKAITSLYSSLLKLINCGPGPRPPALGRR